MKDRYLFRGKRTDGLSKDFMYGSLIYCPSPRESMFIEWYIDNAKYMCEVIPETVGQFTIVIDTNGVNIFEGDKLRSFDSKGNEIIHIVMFDKEEARFALMPNLASQWDTPMRLTQRWVTEFDKQVIGNIYNN